MDRTEAQVVSSPARPLVPGSAVARGDRTQGGRSGHLGADDGVDAVGDTGVNGRHEHPGGQLPGLEGAVDPAGEQRMVGVMSQQIAQRLLGHGDEVLLGRQDRTELRRVALVEQAPCAGVEGARHGRDQRFARRVKGRRQVHHGHGLVEQPVDDVLHALDPVQEGHL